MTKFKLEISSDPIITLTSKLVKLSLPLQGFISLISRNKIRKEFVLVLYNLNTTYKTLFIKEISCCKEVLITVNIVTVVKWIKADPAAGKSIFSVKII